MRKSIIWFFLGILIWGLDAVQAAAASRQAAAGQYEGLYSERTFYSINPKWRLLKGGTPEGDLSVVYDEVSEDSVTISMQIHLCNDSCVSFYGVLEYELLLPNGKQAALINTEVEVSSRKEATFVDQIVLQKPILWSEKLPQCHKITVRVRDSLGQTLDYGTRLLCIRKR